MSKDSRPSTYVRIIDAALELFNEHGERSISTNHIANHLGISPGNLYYHFSNKDKIIIQLFKRYSHTLLTYLTEARLPENIAEAVNYMYGVYDIMWDYRFLFGDVNTLLVRSSELLGEHNEFTRARIAPLLHKLLTQMQTSGMIELDETAKQDLLVNMWLLTKYWFDFDCSMQGRAKLTAESKLRGVFRTLSLLRPYICAAHREEFDRLTRA